MKCFLLLLGSGLLLTGSAHAQQGQLGVRGGATLMSFVTSPFTHRLGGSGVSTSRKVGSELGLYYQVPLTKRLSLVPELQFSHERQHETLTYSDIVTPPTVSDYDLNLSYLNLPVLLRVALGPVYLEAGPQASLLIGGRGQGTTKGTLLNKGMYTRPIDQAATDRYTRLDTGLCLGVGARLPAGLGVSLRAYQGLAQLNRGNENTPTSIPYSGNYEYRQVFSASLTYQVTTTHQ